MTVISDNNNNKGTDRDGVFYFLLSYTQEYAVHCTIHNT